MQIEQVAEPQHLYLAWQAPEHLGDRHRWAVGLITPTVGGAELRYFLDNDEFRAVNSGRPMSDMIALGYEGFPALRRSRTVHKEGVLEALMRRLPPRSRPDFSAYLNTIGFAPQVVPSDLALISYTEAKLPSDGFSVVDPLDPDASMIDAVLEIAGTRYYLKEPPREWLGHALTLLPEPDNKFDAGAIMVLHGEQPIGYINRLQAPTVAKWMKRRAVQASLFKINGTSERPRLFAFIRVAGDGLSADKAAA